MSQIKWQQAKKGIRKHKSDLVILFATLGLMAIGLIMIYAIGPMRANVLNSTYGLNYGANYFFFRQFLSVLIAVVAFYGVFLWLPYEKISKIAKWIMLLGLGLAFLMWGLSLIESPLVKCELGACRWFKFGNISFQLAELLKLGLVLYLANLISRKQQEGMVGKDFWLPIAVISFLTLFIVVVLQKDLGTGVVMMMIILGMLLVSGVSWKQFSIVLVLVLSLVGLTVGMFPHRMKRLTTFLGGGDADASYHVDNAMLAIGTGGMFGVGIGNSVQATGYLPESINDSVFAVMGETFGFVGLMMIVVVFMVVLLRMLRVAERVGQVNQRLMVVGVFAWMATHVVVNMAAMTGLVPLTGITLPLLSYGGTSMLFMAMAIGLCLQISCYTKREVDDEDISSWRGVRRSRNSNRRSGA